MDRLGQFFRSYSILGIHKRMRVLLLDGHPDDGRFSSHLLQIYEDALPQEVSIERVAVRDMSLTPMLRFGYAKRTEWEPDILSLAQKLDQCDHLVVSFPMWWGSEPAELKGLLDRVLLPGFAFAYHEDAPWWDKLLEGRSADVIATMDTPPLFLRLMYGNAIVKRWKRQVLGFCGFKPVRFLACGPIIDDGVEKGLEKWKAQIGKLAKTIKPVSGDKKQLRLDRFLNRKS